MSWAKVIWERLLPILAERGYLIPAINTDSVDYLACAVQLAQSIRQWHPKANIAVLTMSGFGDPVFDHVIALPHGDLGGYANDWQCMEASPYRQTIKLEADMVMASGIDHWWTLFEHRDVVVSQGCRDIYDQPAGSRYYRALFDRNHLPDLYNAITYWRYCQTAREFFGLVRNIFENWTNYSRILKQPDQEPSTDVVYAMAAVLMGPERVTLPPGLGPTIVHMKQHIIPTLTQDWTRELVWENTKPGLRINTVAQSGAVHYHVKDWRIDG
jgi:hypothetical protein